ncbi:olfactory receptor 52E4-like [Pyxicephalus adspersus]|uniref:olfactory receptor 52E4-like n=1 Tax=Pyxicephalus adspersus TaxID=30357 RepID=UPI003B5B351A
MVNSTQSSPSLFTLEFGELNELKYLYCAITLLGFLIILFSNGVIIFTVILHPALHEPMYIFLSALCINGLYGSLGFFPKFFVNLLQQVPTITYIGCLTQIFCVHTYSGCEITLLGVMAYDRYVYICNPLRYNNIMPLSTVFKLIAIVWIVNVIVFTIHFSLTIRLPLCGSVIQKVYCDNFSVVNLSCVDTTINNVFGLFLTLSLLTTMPLLIIFSYIQIIRVCGKSSKDFRAKAFQTCTPHIVTMLNYIADILFEVLLHRFKPKYLPYELRIVMSVQGFVVPPLLNPLIYGLKLKEIRLKIFQLLHVKKILG